MYKFSLEYNINKNIVGNIYDDRNSWTPGATEMLEMFINY